MLEIIQKLLAKENPETKEHPDVDGFLTKEDNQKLKHAGMKPASVHRKKTYKTWECRTCEHAFYYAVLRCPVCESDNITEVVQPTKYEYNGFDFNDEVKA